MELALVCRFPPVAVDENHLLMMEVLDFAGKEAWKSGNNQQRMKNIFMEFKTFIQLCQVLTVGKSHANINSAIQY